MLKTMVTGTFDRRKGTQQSVKPSAVLIKYKGLDILSKPLSPEAFAFGFAFAFVFSYCVYLPTNLPSSTQLNNKFFPKYRVHIQWFVGANLSDGRDYANLGNLPPKPAK